MFLNTEHKHLIAVYCIINKVNGRRYIGQSVNVYKRIVSIRSKLKLRNSRCANRFLIEDYHKYGDANFEYEIVETFDVADKKVMLEREVFWMDYFKTCDPKFGYNLRRDEENGVKTHYLTSVKIAESLKNRYFSEEERAKTGESSSKFWKENPDKKEQMREKLKLKNSKFKFLQINKFDNTLVKEWETISDILRENPSYKKHNIYAACSGEKPSIYGFKWEKVKKG
jgi:COX1-I5 (fragment)